MTDGGRWAVVLGCSTGTGAAIARAVARDPGLHVFGVHRGHYPEEARVLEADLRGAGRRVVLHQADAGTPEGVTACVEALRAAAGARSVGLMVHSLSGASVGRFLSGHDDAFQTRQFEKTFNNLAHSFAWWAQALHQGDLLAPGARLLGLTSPHEDIYWNCGLIAAAKAALQMYIRYLARELGPLGHRVNLLMFGAVITPALAKVLDEAAMQRLEEQHRHLMPAGRICTVEDVARAASYLAREESAWFNGATIDYTGGVTFSFPDFAFKNV